MSILIKGLDMPKDGEILYINIYSTGKVAHDFDLKCKQIATAVSVPPHGRLGDLDALAAQCDDPYWCVWLSDIEAAPTIIEEER